MAHTWLHNPDTGGTWACPDAVVDVYHKRGWVPCEAPESDESHLHDPQLPATPPAETSKAARRGQTTAKEQ